MILSGGSTIARKDTVSFLVVVVIDYNLTCLGPNSSRTTDTGSGVVICTNTGADIGTGTNLIGPGVDTNFDG